MKFRSLAVAALALFAFTASSQAQDASFPPANGGTSVTNPASHYSFTDTGARGVNPKTGIQFSNVWGDATKGAHGAFFRFDPGFVSKLHSHTYDYTRSSSKGSWKTISRAEAEEARTGLILVSACKAGPHDGRASPSSRAQIYIVQQNKFDAQISAHHRNRRSRALRRTSLGVSSVRRSPRGALQVPLQRTAPRAEQTAVIAARPGPSCCRSPAGHPRKQTLHPRRHAAVGEHDWTSP